MLCILVSLKGMIRVWGRKWISDYLFLRKYDNTPFPKKISCSRDVLNTYARASSKGKKVILVLCTHKTHCLNVHCFLCVKVHILCVTDKAFNKIIFSSLQYKYRRLWRPTIVTRPQMQADWVWAAGSAERDLKLQIWRQALQVGGLKFLHPAQLVDGADFAVEAAVVGDGACLIIINVGMAL